MGFQEFGYYIYRELKHLEKKIECLEDFLNVEYKEKDESYPKYIKKAPEVSIYFDVDVPK